MDMNVERHTTQLRGVTTHNLKNIAVDIPHNMLTVVTGVSGSGKSSLAFDTLYAEGQRRYTESLSTYARQFIQQLERPPVDSVKYIQPAVALRQKNEVSNARSTVGTITEIDDHLHLLYTHIGVTICPESGEVVRRDSITSSLEDMLNMPEGTKLIIVAPVRIEQAKTRPLLLSKLAQEGYRRVYMNGEVVDIDQGEAVEVVLGLDELHVVVDRVVVKSSNKMRLSEALQAAFGVGKGRVHIYEHKGREPVRVYDQAFRCNATGRAFVEPQPALFSFNSSLGACPKCSGVGKTVGLDFGKVIPNTSLSITRGAVAPFESTKYKRYKEMLLRACVKEGVPVDLSFGKLVAEHQHFVREGGDGWMGVRGFFRLLEQKQYKTHIRIFMARYRGYDRCDQCLGSRLSMDARSVFIHGYRISSFWGMRIGAMRQTLRHLPWTQEELDTAKVLLDEILHRLDYMERVGLGYLTLERQSRTLSGGEMQRIHLTASLGRALTETLYVLDEPTAGLHARDSLQLLAVLQNLRDAGNTVVVVEHDPDIIEGADHVIEVGPLGGARGGELVFSGSLEKFQESETLTSVSLSARTPIPEVPVFAPDLGTGIDIKGACEHNLNDVDVRIPYACMTSVTGVSGSGKSTLMHRVLFNNWKKSKGWAGVEVGAVGAIEGMTVFSDVILMNQSALGRSSRSNAMSYTKAYDDVRKLYAQTQDAKRIGLTLGDFSFNTPGGRCEHCQGTGKIVIEMHFMADVEITCHVCKGRRFEDRVLEVLYKDASIDDVLQMTVTQGVEFFRDHKAIVRKLEPLLAVGLGYLMLGQSTTTLSGGEAQRLKLATYIAQGRKKTSKDRLLFIFDEPTIGLHLKDIEVLVLALRKLVEVGHTVVVIEHNVDFIAQSDYVVDLGPGAGPEGGQVVACGTPRELAKEAQSLTGRFIAELLAQQQ